MRQLRDVDHEDRRTTSDQVPKPNVPTFLMPRWSTDQVDEDIRRAGMADTASDNTWYRLRYALRTLLRKQSSSPPAFAPGLADWLGTNFSIGTAVRSGSLSAGQARIGGENASLASWQFDRNHLDTRG
jgi:hypothetical protein